MEQGLSSPELTYSTLPYAQQEWVNFNAVQGLITDIDGTPRKMTVAEFAATVAQVNPKTCYRWSHGIPDFWQLVNYRRRILGSGARTQKVWNSVFLSATVKLNPIAQKMWLANHDPNYREPSQPVVHSAEGGLLELMAAHRNRIQVENKQVIDAEPADQS